MTDPSSPRPAPGPADVAIIGMGVLLPGARDVRAYWSNILNGTNSIREIPPERFRGLGEDALIATGQLRDFRCCFGTVGADGTIDPHAAEVLGVGVGDPISWIGR